MRETTTSHVASLLGISPGALEDAGKKNPVTQNDGENFASEEHSTIIPRRVSASTELLCRLAILSPEARLWLGTFSNQTPGKYTDLDPELLILEELLTALHGLDDSSPKAVLSRLSPDLQVLVSAWDLAKLPAAPLAAAQDAIRGLQLTMLKKHRESLALQLQNPNLASEKIMELQKEILDLQASINDLSAPQH